MSVVPLHPSGPTSTLTQPWIINSWLDQLLIVLTPLLVIPAVIALNSPLGVKAETISLVVTAFFAVGHHLPGLIRAYGDAELFQRFRWRFLLSPPLLFIAYFPIVFYHPNFYSLVILLWATWHGLMQLYGFVRIYDAKVGSISSATALWDWRVCVTGFVTVEVYSSSRMAFFLDCWYSLGGPLIPPGVFSVFRWTCLITSALVFIGFAVNYATQWRRGPKPNPVKLMLLASGIGSWWFAIGYLENVILGVALFDICHDVQYLAIVWMYNCRRVSSNPEISGFMRYVFRRGMLLIYLGLIAAYGAIGLIPSLVNDRTIAMIFNGILGTSTLLHYYYDGFIWKVRERSTQASLGLQRDASAANDKTKSVAGFSHLLKWSPLIVAMAWVFINDSMGPSLSQNRKDEIVRQYTRTLVGVTILPEGIEDRSWLYTIFERVQNIAAAVPDDRVSQLRAAVMQANFGQNDEAIERLKKVLARHPNCSEADIFLGGIHSYRGQLDKAAECFESALSHATSSNEKAIANLKLGEVYLRRHDFGSAAERFDDALRDNPQLKTSIDALRKQGELDQSVN